MAVKTRYISNLTLFYLLSLVTLTLFFELWRLILLVQLRDLAEGVPLAVLAGSFAVGWRFDFAVSSYILLPIVLLGSLPWLDISRNRYIRWFNLLLLYLLVAAAFFATLVDIEFFRAFNTRLNGMALQWNNTPGIAASMIWEMYPVVRYFLLYFVILWGFIAVVRHWLRDLVINRKPSPVLTNVLYLLPLLGLLLLGARGRVDVKTPLTWGAAYFCEYDFANQLALNPNFTFMRDVAYDSGKWRRAERLISGIYNPRAEHIVYGLLGIPDTTAIGGRMHRQVRFQPQNNDPANVILIIMESFGSSRIGCLNEQVPYDLSPHFDAMAEHSLLFTNFYSSGMHTSSGVFSTLYGAPIMLGRNLMKHMAGQNRFWGLPNILREHGYRTLFFVPHDPHVDNLQGFLKANGMTRVYAVADYDDDRRIGTWGVPDHVMFDYAYAFLSRIKDERFFATLLTVSNHGPWQVPDVPFAPLPDEIPGHKELNAFKYSDWALGRFLDAILSDSSFANTLIIITADSGSPDRPRVDLDLSVFHIPLLVCHADWGKGQGRGRRLDRLGGQLDILATVMGQLRLDYDDYSFGHDLLDSSAAGVDFAHFSEWYKIGYLEGDYYAIVRTQAQPSLFRRSDLSRNLADSFPGLIGDYQQKALAIYQTAYYNMRRPLPPRSAER